MSSELKKQAYETQFETNPDIDDWQQYAARGKEQLLEMVGDNAGRSMLVALGAGLGVGLLIGSALAGSSRSARWYDRSSAEGLGRRVLDTLEGIVPSALSDRL